MHWAQSVELTQDMIYFNRNGYQLLQPHHELYKQTIQLTAWTTRDPFDIYANQSGDVQ